VWSTIVLLCLDNCCMLLLAGPAVFQCLYDDDDVETFFIFLIFSRQFSLSLPLPYWSFIVCVLKRLFPFVDSK
jgi:hypothetical protein